MPSPKTVSFFGFDELVRVPSDYLDAAPPVAEETPRARMRAPSSRASPSIMFVPGELLVPVLTPHQGNDGMAFRQGVADDQPSGSARCTQNKNLHVRCRSSLV